jgi:DeoR/GlpR family transcriptional regulator of sugar metabolism
MMLSAARANRLLEMLQAEGTLSVALTAKRLGVSESTIRRDLAQLERQGRLSRVYGGALIDPSSEVGSEPPRVTRKFEQSEQKRRIGEAAARLVGDNCTILVAGGTTTDAMLPYLGGRGRLTVVTNNLQTAVLVAEHPDVAVVVVGGYLRRDELSLLGHLSTPVLAQLNIEKAFFSAYAVDATGIMGAELNEIQTDRALISAASELVVLADSSKFARKGPARITGANEIAVLVTDDGAPAGTLRELESLGVAVITC